MQWLKKEEKLKRSDSLNKRVVLSCPAASGLGLDRIPREAWDEIIVKTHFPKAETLQMSLTAEGMEALTSAW